MFQEISGKVIVEMHHVGLFTTWMTIKKSLCENASNNEMYILLQQSNLNN